MKHKLILIPSISIVLLAGLLLGIWYWISMAGTSPVERWIASQVKHIAGSYLNPRVEFDDLDYQRPYTVVLTRFRLTVDDPDNAGKTLDVIAVDKLRLELAEIPETGKPIRISKLILDHPKINAISSRKDGRFMGFGDMLKDTKPPATQPAPGEAPRLSDVFQIVLLQIIEGQVVYESRGSGQPPMVLDAINSRMDVQKDDQGWYKLAATLDRKPVFALVGGGRLDMDHMVLALDSLNLEIELGEKQYGSLPGNIQQLLKAHEVTGVMKLAASGRVPLGDPASSDLAATLLVDKAHFVAGEYKGEADNVNAKALLKDHHAVLDHLDADTLKGKVRLAADVALAAPYDGQVQVTTKDVLIEETLRAAGSDPKYKGVVNAEVTLSGPMNMLLTRAGGNGWLTLRNGRLTKQRVVADIGQALAQKINSILTGPKGSQDADTADLEFRFIGDKVHFTRIAAQTSSFSVTGNGDVWFDKRLNLLLNGGPPQKPTASDSGGGNQVVKGIGDLLHTAGRGATDLATEIFNQVATIIVDGTIDEPRVRVEAFR